MKGLYVAVWGLGALALVWWVRMRRRSIPELNQLTIRGRSWQDLT
jgi:hypothetical protein